MVSRTPLIFTGMDTLIKTIVAHGIPGLVLVIIMGVVGWTGAAAITAALATLGGPFGMLEGHRSPAPTT
jgi:hypothetical protein